MQKTAAVVILATMLSLPVPAVLSPGSYLKCDPRIANVPSRQDRAQAGVGSWENIYFTRLHVRYNRKAFPQDLLFQETANTENFQTRYIITHPDTGEMDCPEGKKYPEDLKQRRQDELEMLTHLTGRGPTDWDLTQMEQEKALPPQDTYAAAAAMLKEKNDSPAGFILLVSALGLISLTRWGYREGRGRGC